MHAASHTLRTSACVDVGHASFSKFPDDGTYAPSLICIQLQHRTIIELRWNKKDMIVTDNGGRYVQEEWKIT